MDKTMADRFMMIHQITHSVDYDQLVVETFGYLT